MLFGLPLAERGAASLVRRASQVLGRVQPAECHCKMSRELDSLKEGRCVDILTVENVVGSLVSTCSTVSGFDLARRSFQNMSEIRIALSNISAQ